jgi:hypothetical protein
MACLIKLPEGASKGTVTFTTVEWRLMKSDSGLLNRLQQLRSKYVLGLHFNWHDYEFAPPKEFDFFMAGPEDLKPVVDTPYRLIPMDACNFTPQAYRPFPAEEKFWDVLAVGNPVFFKRPEVVLQTIRRLFDATEKPLRVLFICPIPRHRLLDEDTVFYDVRKYYESLFSAEERSRFTLLTTTFNSPNPFDRNTLSVFFRNSRVFLHCPTEERRCRIAAYAWCAGLPVVAYESVASIVPPALRGEPGYYRVQTDADYVPQLLKAIDRAEDYDAARYQDELSETRTIGTLGVALRATYAALGIPFEGDLLTANLDRRLGWHHQGLGGASNGVDQRLEAFMSVLDRYDDRIPVERRRDIATAAYPERLLEQGSDQKPLRRLQDVERTSIYLNKARGRWLKLAKLLRARLGMG